MKKCCGCKQQLPEKNFNKHRGTYDGLQGMCRQCQLAYNQKRNFPPCENPMRSKLCARCKHAYPATLEYFSPNKSSNDGMAYHCKPCAVKIMTEWNQKNPNKYKRKVAKSGLTRSMKKLGMTQEDLDRLVKEQQNKCAICGTDSPIGHGRRLVIDHNHATGHPRGLLCSKCNTGIGLFDEDPRILKSAIAYLACWESS